MRIERAEGLGFCFGVKRALAILEDVARQKGGVETLGALVHNQQVMSRLNGLGVRVVKDIAEIAGDTVVISSHGVGPKVLAEIKSRGIGIVDTTCPFVQRAQTAARRLSEAGFFTVIYGDVNHPEVKGILGWAEGKGIATLSAGDLDQIELPRHIGLLSQTTQVPARFIDFVKTITERALVKDAELRLVDTVCHDIRQRQAAALDLARRADLMLVIGGHHSANTRHLVDLCSPHTETHLIETAAEINSGWLAGKELIGVTAGASTAPETIDAVVLRLEESAPR
ncbi:4-hydroxy-3-methylbut-2-enyl diphosphate reductase [Dehalogenimonas alkenigignens]|uniref:4-hydroxy-3-methylbut-2-enyl diphosphate reductase n=1 Tax=Dehalogenimonas alkenigignens TaxID=1217799 RepID=A0A0W0GHI1_9CHLR|nr:4-hydroxy-3-methylbut-2-enyl diphosphate reductase [Dehalogenimonas alkenigignens]KTB48024.1 4-hydroxy-3-methylbut-2-enyl diphosphate reductase [Dehalogenimonas alkenigignens]PVV84283.1 4-hydroxy-3-methylbut-2-enyl diphosphate reductase [Dehalogenimonas alkenigignens]